MGLGPAGVGVGGAARENVFRSSVRAVSRIEVSRPETDTPSREESDRGGQRTQNEAPAEKTGDQKSAPRWQNYCSAPESRGNARAGASKSIALLLPCPLLPVPSRSSSKLDAGSSLSISRATRYHFPGHPLDERGLQRQKGGGLLVSIQERRAAVVPQINRGQPADKPLVQRGLCSSTGLHSISLVRAFTETSRTYVVVGRMGDTRDSCLLGEPLRRRRTLPGSTQPRCPVVRRPDATRPWYVWPGFRFDRSNYHGARKCGFGAKSGSKGTSLNRLDDGSPGHFSQFFAIRLRLSVFDVRIEVCFSL